MSTNITYILSDVDKAIAFEWIAEAFQDTSLKLSFILLNQRDSHLETYLREHQIPVHRVHYRGKKDAFKAIRSIRKILQQTGSHIVHTHLFDASIFGLLAARLARVPQRVYTRHHGTLHHEFFPRAVYYDKLIHSFATDIIAISGVVKDVLIHKEKVKPHKVHLVPHGFDLEGFTTINPDKVEALKSKYHTQGKYPIVGVIARQTYWKGIQHIIPAFARLLKDYPKAHLVLANAKGDYKTEIDRLLQPLPSDSFTEIVFENDIYHLYQLFDVYVHTPVDPALEAFGQTYVEALAAGVPAVFSLSGIAPEFIKDQHNALVVPFKDTDAIYQRLLTLLQNPELVQNITQQGQKDVKEKFALSRMISALKKVYAI